MPDDQRREPKAEMLKGRTRLVELAELPPGRMYELRYSDRDAVYQVLAALDSANIQERQAAAELVDALAEIERLTKSATDANAYAEKQTDFAFQTRERLAVAEAEIDRLKALLCEVRGCDLTDPDDPLNRAIDREVSDYGD